MEPPSEDDILRAVQELQKLGGGFGVVDVPGVAGGGPRLVRSVPVELSPDTAAVLALAASVPRGGPGGIDADAVPGGGGGGGGGGGSGRSGAGGAMDRGWVTAEGVAASKGWAMPRSLAALDALLKLGLAMVDDGARDGRRRYYFGGLDVGEG